MTYFISYFLFLVQQSKSRAKVYSIIKKYGFKIHTRNDKKAFRGHACEKSIITGINISKRGLRILQKHKNNIIEIIDKKEHVTKRKRLIGLINYAIQVNPKYIRYLKLLKKKKII